MKPVFVIPCCYHYLDRLKVQTKQLEGDIKVIKTLQTLYIMVKSKKFWNIPLYCL